MITVANADMNVPTKTANADILPTTLSKILQTFAPDSSVLEPGASPSPLHVPHLLFHGEPGTGKKQMVHQLIRQLYIGAVRQQIERQVTSSLELVPFSSTLSSTLSLSSNERMYMNDLLRRNVMWVNCAQGKGIKFIRTDIKFFAQTNVEQFVPFKIIVLLNADFLTIDAQSALRRCIEQYSNNTRFFGIVHNKNRLIFPILSRFCDIHIPTPIDSTTGESINYYQSQIRARFATQSQPQPQPQSHSIDCCLRDIMDNQGCLSVDPVAQFRTAIRLYECGISSVNVLQWISSTPLLSANNRVILRMQASKERTEYRNEKLFILRLLHNIAKAQQQQQSQSQSQAQPP